MLDIQKTELAPYGWLNTYLGKLCDVVRGGSPRPIGNPKYFNGTIPFIKINDITKLKSRTIYDSETKVNEAGSQKSRLLPKGSLILSNSGTICIPKFLGVDACIHDGFVSFINLNKFVLSEYLFHFFYYIRPYIIQKHKQGVTQINLNTKIVSDINILIPGKEEQYQIVSKIEELFSELDSATQSLKKAQEQLKTYRQSVLKHAFEGKLTEEWRKRQKEAGNPPESAEKLLERIKQEREDHYQKQLEEWKKACEQAEAEGTKKPTKPKKPKDLPPLTKEELADLPELPEGWEWSYFDFIGYWTGGGTPSKKQKRFWSDGNILWISPKDIKAKYIKSTQDKITQEAIKNSSTKMVKNGSVLFVVRSGILRRILPIAITSQESTVNQDIQALTLFLINREYIYWYSVSHDFNIRNNCAKYGTTVESIETRSLKNYKVPLPSLNEQNQIVSEIESRLSVCDQLEKSIEDSLNKTEALRQSILKKAFSGELTKQWREAHPELISGGNSAEKLLERITDEKQRMDSRKAAKNAK
jgi:type I restriction enzyme S subunit